MVQVQLTFTFCEALALYSLRFGRGGTACYLTAGLPHDLRSWTAKEMDVFDGKLQFVREACIR